MIRINEPLHCSFFRSPNQCPPKQSKYPMKNQRLPALYLRRFLLFCAVWCFVLSYSSIAVRGQETLRLFIGTYTGGERGGEGIYTCQFNLINGSLSEPVLAAKCENPAFLAIHPVQPRLYAVGEQGKTGTLYAFTFRKTTGELMLLDTAEIPGRSSCHLCICRDAEKELDSVVVANYSSGNVVSFPIFATGKIGKIASDIAHIGKGPNESRQQSPHPHGAYFDFQDGKTVAVPDLGIDRVLFYEIDTKTAKLTRKLSQPFLQLPPGGGPRHMARSKDGRFAYVNNELTSTVCVFELKGKHPPMIQELSTLPNGVDPTKNSTAEIELSPSGDFLYVSNRGHDSIAVYAVDQKTGNLNPEQNIPGGGVRPRFFALDPTGRYLFTCNKESGNIVVFSVDQSTGKLTQTETAINVPRPVCIVFAP